MTATDVVRTAYGEVARFRGAVELGWYDFTTSYRRSLIGPFWITIQFCVWIGALTLILHAQLGDSMGSYAMYVALGMLVWEPMVGAMIEGPKHFSQHAQLIKSVPIKLSQLSVRKLAFLLFRAGMTIPVVLALMLISNAPITLSTLLLAPAVILVLMTMYSCIVLFGFIGAYQRDFEFFVPAATRFLFFVTPIIWQANEGIRKTISFFNPFTYYLEIVRGPLLGAPPSLLTWAIVTAISFAGFIAALTVQSFFRKSVIFWI